LLLVVAASLVVVPRPSSAELAGDVEQAQSEAPAPADAESAPSTQLEYVPPASGGFPLARGRWGLVIDTGFPFLELQLGYGIHDAFQISLSYRSFIFTTHSPYLSFKARFFRSESGSTALSFLGGVGYQGVTGLLSMATDVLVGGNSIYGELSLVGSYRNGRHQLDYLMGVRLGWCQDNAHVRDVALDDNPGAGYCFTSVEEGSSTRSSTDGLLATVMVDLGYSYRINRVFSYYVAFGIEVRPNTAVFPTMTARFRNGFAFDF